MDSVKKSQAIRHIISRQFVIGVLKIDARLMSLANSRWSHRPIFGIISPCAMCNTGLHCNEADCVISPGRSGWYIRKPTGSGVECAECSLIIGMCYWVQVFCLIIDDSFFQWAFSLLEFQLHRPWVRIRHSAEDRTQLIVSFRFENHLPVPEHQHQQQQTCISLESGAKSRWS